MPQALREFNFDGLIGPTHNYAGLSYGNVASASHRHQVAHPKRAALQGLSKMKTLFDLGIGQAILPPLRRPSFNFLRCLGFTGDDRQLLQQASQASEVLLATCYSASNMWTANAATVSPASDTVDGRLHVTAANLASTLHRSIEHPATFGNLKQIFKDDDQFCISPALPSQPGLADEGAANHTRLCAPGFVSESRGIEIFVFGEDTILRDGARPEKFPARQTRLSCEAIARAHLLDPERTFFVQQNPVAIDAGVFHNDVISVGHQNVLLCHECSFLEQADFLQRLKQRFEAEFEQTLYVVEFSSSELSLGNAVASYLFNSQLVTRPDGGMTLVCPTECESNLEAKKCTERLVGEDNPVDQVLFLDLRQSMNNGGGPACLRLRVALSEAQVARIHQGVIFDETLFERLTHWVNEHYRDELGPRELADWALVDEVNRAFEELESILGMTCY